MKNFKGILTEILIVLVAGIVLGILLVEGRGRLYSYPKCIPGRLEYRADMSGCPVLCDPER